MTGRAAPGRVGRSDVHLSSITLGTMRLSRAGDTRAASALLGLALDRGITSFHCSSEYDTFPLFADAWAAGPGSGSVPTQIIAKVAVPHFGEACFSAPAFRQKVDFYLGALGIEQLDVVQWLLRYDLKQEQARLEILEEAAAEVAAVVDELKRAGKIGALVGFPYTAGVAGGLLGADYSDGLALYVNPLEREMDSFVKAAEEAGKSVVAIRPFAAGRVFTETDAGAREALDHVFAFPAVVSAVVSASTVEHLDELQAAVPAGT